MAPDWRLLSAIASHEAGEPVRVGPLPSEHAHSCAGLAGWDGTRHTIHLAERLPPAELLRVMYHEVAHIRLGHVSRAAASLPPGALSPALEARVAEARRGAEANADAWASAKLEGLGPSYAALLAALCARGDGGPDRF